ncbi:MAG TPA: NADH-quinone oxidoreductase subunit NuoF [Candidatus Cloacimonetes bacterium]|nr:NADH-quinone oxidoreductase subunit NuoF [Candidatus Cloacimonadota bacterium]HEX37426.1 NADH-quinone oxidoreductase subunit NuoF [Candidatus Cloacimonadota bacterium]
MENSVKIKVGLASCGIAAGGLDVFEKVENFLKDKEIEAELMNTGCMGMCYAEVLMEIDDEEFGNTMYGYLNADDIDDILHAHFIKKQPLKDKIVYSDKLGGDEGEILEFQTRIVLRNCGVIDPESIDEYIERGGYKAIEKVLKEKSPIQVIEEIKNSGLRGRGGGGFPTGIKWELTYQETSDKKYIICNADEGDPGAFMDRSVLESDPHSVLEGMLIAAYAVGSDEGYIYCRAEYPLAVKRLRIAIDKARKRGFIGKNILGSNFDFDLTVYEGAGAFVCGEETALIASIEGKRGMPRIRPPYPAQAGLWGKPTNNNNVETYANVAWIIRNGATKYAEFGTEKSKGTKVFALTGKIKNGGLVEVPMGMTLREVIFKVGGGILNDKKFKAVQLGGPSGGCIPESLLDTPVDYDSLVKSGAIMGSGGMVVMDETTCMVDMARFFLNFTQDESCGKCTFCRIGTKRMLEILNRICDGKGEPGDIELLEELSVKIKKGSLCGLGQTAPNPVLTTIKYFRNEYEAHINDKTCPAGVCKALIKYVIDEEKCIGCGACKRACPVDAISGEKKELHTIDQDVCIKCGACMTACKFDAVKKM